MRRNKFNFHIAPCLVFGAIDLFPVVDKEKPNLVLIGGFTRLVLRLPHSLLSAI